MVSLTDPLGVDQRVRAYGRDLFNALAAPLFEPLGQQPVVVVLFRENSLEKLDGRWPINRALHADIVQSIFLMRPRALALDYYLLDRRDRENLLHLRDTLYGPEKPPVYLGAWRKGDTPVAAGLDPRKHAGDTQTARLVSLHREGLRGGHARYAMGAARERREFSPLAYAMFADWCRAHPREPQCNCFPSRFRRPMVVAWTMQPPTYPDMAGMGTTTEWVYDCADDMPKTVLHRILAMIGLQREQDALVQTCPPVRTVPAHLILERPGDPQIRELIRDSFVIYGASLAGESDLIHPPGYEMIPAAYLHAAALANMTAYGHEYMSTQTSLKELTFGPKAVEIAVILVAYVLLYLALKYCTNWMRNRIAPQRSSFARIVTGLSLYFLITLGIVFIFAVMLLGTVLIEVFWLNLAPSNWLAILGLLSVTGALMARPKRLFEDGRPSIDPSVAAQAQDD